MSSLKKHGPYSLIIEILNNNKKNDLHRDIIVRIGGQKQTEFGMVRIKSDRKSLGHEGTGRKRALQLKE